MSGSASASAAMQLRMSPDRRDPQPVAQHARRAAVVGHGHDRGQVAGVLLEAAQQRRQAGPAADGDDPRSARQEPLLVDELARAAGPRRRSGTGPSGRRSRPVRADDDEDHADRRRPGSRAARTAGTGGSARSMRPPARPVGLEVPGDLAEDVGDREGQQQQADEDDQQPALDADPGSQPAPRGSRPVELAVEDRDRAEVLLAQPGRELLGDDDRAVEAAGAADRRSSAASCPRRCRPGPRTSRKSWRNVEEPLRDRLVEDERPDLVGQAGQRPQLRRRRTGSS